VGIGAGGTTTGLGNLGLTCAVAAVAVKARSKQIANCAGRFIGSMMRQATDAVNTMTVASPRLRKIGSGRIALQI
jgi:hypothetical protein